jgi:predicted component of type VI protein secretion system
VSKLTLSFKGKVLKIFPVLTGSMTLGSDPDCDIHIDSLALQPQHSKIDTTNNESVISDMNTEEGTFIAQVKIKGSHVLKDGDVIRVGKHTLTYSFSENEPVQQNRAEENTPIQTDAEEKKQGWLQILNGANLGKTLSLKKSMTNLGKPGISTAVITKRPDGYFISQLEGNHPLLIKDQELGEKSLKLSDGDTIKIGNINMQFYLE